MEMIDKTNGSKVIVPEFNLKNDYVIHIKLSPCQNKLDYEIIKKVEIPPSEFNDKLNSLFKIDGKVLTFDSHFSALSQAKRIKRLFEGTSSQEV